MLNSILLQTKKAQKIIFDNINTEVFVSISFLFKTKQRCSDNFMESGQISPGVWIFITIRKYCVL